MLLNAGNKHPRVDEARVNRSVWRACVGSRTGVASTLDQTHPRMVDAVWVPAVPKANPRTHPRRAVVAV